MRKFLRKLFKMIVILVLLLVLSITAMGYLKYKQAVTNVPISEKVAVLREDENYTTIDSISTDFLEGIVAIEDHRFYEHGAIDPIAIVRATIVNTLQKEIAQGGSTLTQQVAKNMYFNPDQNYTRKVAELFVAHQLEKLYTKDDILELYVNIIYYGDGNHGIKEASENYFGKAPSELNFDEATLLAGLPQAPSAYALSTNYERAKKRQVEVIEALETYRSQ